MKHCCIGIFSYLAEDLVSGLGPEIQLAIVIDKLLVVSFDLDPFDHKSFEGNNCLKYSSESDLKNYFQITNAYVNFWT